DTNIVFNIAIEERLGPVVEADFAKTLFLEPGHDCSECGELHLVGRVLEAAHTTDTGRALQVTYIDCVNPCSVWSVRHDCFSPRRLVYHHDRFSFEAHWNSASKTGATALFRNGKCTVPKERCGQLPNCEPPAHNYPA